MCISVFKKTLLLLQGKQRVFLVVPVMALLLHSCQPKLSHQSCPSEYCRMELVKWNSWGLLELAQHLLADKHRLTCSHFSLYVYVKPNAKASRTSVCFRGACAGKRCWVTGAVSVVWSGRVRHVLLGIVCFPLMPVDLVRKSVCLG